MISYFDQEQQGLDRRNTIYDELGESTDLTREETMYLLSKLLFRGDKAFNRIANLSGGEKNRVVFCKLVYTKSKKHVIEETTKHKEMPKIY